MKSYQFDKTKYGKELLLDCRNFSETKNFILSEDPFTVTFYEIYFITEGQTEFHLDTETIPVKKGTVLLLPPNKCRQWKKARKKIEGYFIIFESEFISSFFRDALFIQRFNFFHNTGTPSYIQLKKPVYNKLFPVLKEIRNEIISLSDDSHHLLRSLFYFLLIKLNRIYTSTYNINHKLFQNNIALQFKKLLENNFKTTHTVDEYSTMIGISRTHLNNKIKKTFGKPVSEMIKERQIIEAKRELLFSSKTAAEIAYDLNFSDPSNFLRFFKNNTGLSTKQFKEKFSK